MGEASNWNPELAPTVKVCRGRFLPQHQHGELRQRTGDGWGGNIPRRMNSVCTDSKMREGAHESKPQREMWAADICHWHIESSSGYGRASGTSRAECVE